MSDLILHEDVKLGKLPARPGAVKLKFADYANTAALPRPPKTFGHDNLVHVNGNWSMLGNDRVGDCVFAGAGHETMLWGAEANHTVQFSDASVLSDYSAVTGYNPADPNSDQGTDMSVAAAYRRKTGVVDLAGKRHQVFAYVALQPGNMAELWAAMYLFGAVGIGFQFPSSAMDQFNAGKPWSVVRGAKIEGGHYVPGVARRGGELIVVTWGREQIMNTTFYAKYADEAIAYISTEALTNGKSLEGFDLQALQGDLATITA